MRNAADDLMATYTYDGQSRRVKKATTSLAPQGATEEVYHYDGWNRVATYQPASGSLQLVATATWGRDLSGTLEGAGGVGGLLGIKEGADSYRVTYDANGNISESIDGNGTIAAHYEYDPFGNVVVASGSYAAANPWRFSTKPVDQETGYSYYGYRFYNPETGRWVNRDSIGEEGGVNLYGMVGNDSVGQWDYLGMAYGKHLTKEEAKSLACAINFWLIDAGIFNAIFLWGENDRSITLKMLHRYMSKSGGTLIVPSSVLLNNSGIQSANDDARRHFRNKGSQPFIRRRIQTTDDLQTAVGRTTAKYTRISVSERGGAKKRLRGELLNERYTFQDTRPDEKLNVNFPFLDLEGYLCCWKGGDHISDHWMGDLQKHGFAKSYNVKGSWIFDP